MLVLIVLFSALAGAARGANGSARQLIRFAVDTALTVLAMLIAWKAAETLSPMLAEWLAGRNIRIPDGEINAFRQFYYTAVTSVRDFPLLRGALLFFVVYLIVRGFLGSMSFLGSGLTRSRRERAVRSSPGLASLSSLTGAILGAVTGAGRAVLFVAILFAYTALFPQTAASDYIQESRVYREGAERIVSPLTGDWLQNRLPVFTESVKNEMSQILQRRYEVEDAAVPGNIAEAAARVTERADTDEEKARALYEWVGTRVRYDWNKYNLYVEKRIWQEQTPEDTFRTREGVCIDYSRLYAVMARSAGLSVRVVTGMGADGTGGYGPHAWNEVRLEGKGWVPLDTTWVSSGGNWFNPPDFASTHIPDRQI
ncbi:transglutaminase domain-containing protein [Gorillibacterium sp. sgz500922]|uniref:transglutaminase domain-containing protein n=1 Tax=Gorillibacterium sp. sgz500922 TaxID=3446694 RepID=UPI003F672779